MTLRQGRFLRMSRPQTKKSSPPTLRRKRSNFFSSLLERFSLPPNVSLSFPRRRESRTLRRGRKSGFPLSSV